MIEEAVNTIQARFDQSNGGPQIPKAKKSELSWGRRYFGVRYWLRKSRTDFVKMVLADAETWEVDQADRARLLQMVREAGQVDFFPELDWVLKMRLLHVSRLKDNILIEAEISKTLESLRTLIGERGVQHWAIDRKSLDKGESGKLHFLKSLTKELFISYQTRCTVEIVKANLLLSTIAAYISFMVVFVILFWATHRVVLLMFGCGLSGAWLSIYQRVAKLDNAEIDIKQLASFLNAPHGLGVSLMFGTVAPVLMVLFVSSGLIHSTFFPKIDSLDLLTQTYGAFKSEFLANSAKELHRYLVSYKASDPSDTQAAGAEASNAATARFIADLERTPAEDLEHLGGLKFERAFAKLMLMSFVCGFGERIIHDAIAGLMKRFGKQAPDGRVQGATSE